MDGNLSLPPSHWGDELKQLISHELANSAPEPATGLWKSLSKFINTISGDAVSPAHLPQTEWVKWVQDRKVELDQLKTESASGRTHKVALLALNFAHALEKRYENHPEKAAIYQNLEMQYCRTLASEIGGEGLAALVQRLGLEEEPIGLGHALADLRVMQEEWIHASASAIDARSTMNAFALELKFYRAVTEFLDQHLDRTALKDLAMSLNIDFLQSQGKAYAGWIACAAFLDELQPPSPDDLKEYEHNWVMLETRIDSITNMLAMLTIPNSDQVLSPKQIGPLYAHLEQLLAIKEQHLNDHLTDLRKHCAHIEQGLESIKIMPHLELEGKVLVLGDVIDQAPLAWSSYWEIAPEAGEIVYRQWAAEELGRMNNAMERLGDLAHRRADLRQWVATLQIPGFMPIAAEKLVFMDADARLTLRHRRTREQFKLAVLSDLTGAEVSTWPQPQVPPRTRIVVDKSSLAWELAQEKMRTIFSLEMRVFPEFEHVVMENLVHLAKHRGMELEDLVKVLPSDAALREGLKVSTLLKIARSSR